MTPPKKKVVLCTPVASHPWNGLPAPEFRDAWEASVDVVEAAGWECVASVPEVGNPYISAARATMLRRALDVKPECIVFLDYDLSWSPDAILRLINTPDQVVAGTYRFKDPETDRYMGKVEVVPGTKKPVRRSDGCVKAHFVPAGFLKVTYEAVQQFALWYPELLYGDPCAPHVDIFNHGAAANVWWGEDYGFSRRWILKGGEIWIIPDLDLDHHGFIPIMEEGRVIDRVPAVWKGNFLNWMKRQAKGAKPELPTKKHAGVPELASADDFPDLVAAA